jgi:SAM-dependent methyltransferase
MSAGRRARSIARSVVDRLPGPIAEALRSGVHAVRRIRAGRRRDAARYPTGIRIGHHPAIGRAWADPPPIDNPFNPISPVDPAPVRSYDLELFEALNAEYAEHPLVNSAPMYDYDAVAQRSRSRLGGIHERIGLDGRTVLEVGCGAGFEVWNLAHHFGSDAWGIDMSPRAGWPALRGEHVHLIEGDIAGDHGLAPGSFDRAISFTVWEHITHPESALRELYRVMKPGGLAWIRANLYRGPTASHLYRDITFPFPHLLFQDDVIAAALVRAGKRAEGAAWVNKLTWEQYEAAMLRIGFRIRSLRFDLYPIDEAFYARFEDILGRYPRADLERGFFTVVLEKPR